LKSKKNKLVYLLIEKSAIRKNSIIIEIIDNEGFLKK